MATKAKSIDLTSAYVKELDFEHRNRYYSKLKIYINANDTINIQDPYGGGLQYINNPKKWPSSFSYGDLYTYLIDGPGIFNKESMKAYKSLEAYSYFISNFVSAVLYSPVSNNSPVCILRSRVRHSQRMNDKPVDVWVMLHKENGSVYTAHCQCMAGLGEACSHVAAVLFKVEAFNRLERPEISCTGTACEWNKMKTDVKDLEHMPIVDMCFTKPKYGRPVRKKVGPSHRKLPKLSLEHLDLHKLQQVNPEAGIFSILPKLDAEETDSAFEDGEYVNLEKAGVTVKPICNLLPCQLSNEHILKNIMIAKSHVKNVADVTSGQCNNPVWHKFRFGRITSSNISDAYKIANGSSKQNPATVCQQMLGMSSILNLKRIPHPIKWGRDNEKHGITLFKKYLIENGHKNVLMSFPGIFINAEHSYIGSSPDAVVECTCCGVRPVECKCPFSSVITPPPQELDPNTKEFAKNVPYTVFKDDKICLKRTHKHYMQILCHIGVMNDNGMNCDSGYFIIWTKKGLFVEIVEHNLQLWDDVKKHSLTFFMSYLQPELVKVLSVKNSDCIIKDLVPFTCQICKKECKDIPDSIPSIQCCDCKLWFHLPCVGLDENAEVVEHEHANWLCPECLK